MSDTDLSGRIRQRREQLGLSQEELAARMGYRSKSSITKLEKGINDLPQSKLEELAAALDGGERFELLIIYGYPDGGRTGMELA